MTESVQNFRAAFHGFNREDVVRFLEATAARHAAEVNQLRDDVKRLEEELASPRDRQTQPDREEWEALQAENASLKAQIEELETQLTEPAAPPSAGEKTDWEGEELAAYRRAELVERQARNRAAQMYHRVNGLIADLAARMEESKAGMDQAAEALGQALDRLQRALDDGLAVLTEGAATLKTMELETPEKSDEEYSRRSNFLLIFSRWKKGLHQNRFFKKQPKIYGTENEFFRFCAILTTFSKRTFAKIEL